MKYYNDKKVKKSFFIFNFIRIADLFLFIKNNNKIAIKKILAKTNSESKSLKYLNYKKHDQCNNKI